MVSVVFGVWHLGASTAGLGGNFRAGAAYGVLDEALIGLGFALMVYHTRNLLTPSIFHVMPNTAFGSLVRSLL